MEKENCESCFDEIQAKTDAFLELQSLKHDQFLTKMEGRHRDLTIVNMSILGMFGLAIAYIFSVQLSKAARAETVSIKQAKEIEQTMSKYFDQKFIHNDGSTIDESTYKWHIETIFDSNTRGIESKN